MKDGMTRWRAATVVLLALAAGACGSDTKSGEGTAGSAGTAGGTAANASGAGQSAGGAGAGGTATSVDDMGAGAAGGDTAVLGPSADCTFEIAIKAPQVIDYAPALLGCTTLGQELYAVFVNETGWQTEFFATNFNEGETNVPMPARFQIGKLNFGGWAIDDIGGCTVEVTEQVLLGPAPYADRAGTGRQYRISGHGDCTQPAVDRTGMMADAIPGPFSFRARKSFYDMH